MQSPVENFDWDAFEKGEVAGEKSREDLEAAYSSRRPSGLRKTR